LALICVMSVFEEEELIAEAIRSCAGIGIDRVVVLDGAWIGFSSNCHSQDDTVPIARNEGAIGVRPEHTWKSQAHKRTYMFHNCGAGEGDHVVVLDADERFTTSSLFPTLENTHYAVYARTIGECEPGRVAYPQGDYSPKYQPFLRLFAYRKNLVCAFSGGYWDGSLRIRLKNVPVLDGVLIDERWDLRTDARRAQKATFLEGYLPQRKELVDHVKENKGKLPEALRKELLDFV